MADVALINGVELAWWEVGAGQPVLCLHETAAGGEVWRALAAAVGDRARTIAYDRRGWGRSGAPEPYTRTTIEEQAADAAALLERLDAAPAIVCGAGLGAIAGLDLALRRPALVDAAVLIEPPLLALVPEATEALAADRVALTEAVQAGGPEAGLELYLSGALRAAAGMQRLPAELAQRGRPLSFFAELGAVPGWPLPIPVLRSCEVACRVVVSTSTPPLTRAAAEALGSRLPGAELLELEGSGLPHLDPAAELAEAVIGLVSGDEPR